MPFLGQIIGALLALLGAVPGLVHPTSHFRYCEKPGLAGQFVKAKGNVPCSTAKALRDDSLSPPCINWVACDTMGFRCRSRYADAQDAPFSYTHHGICSNGSGRVVFDGG